MTSRAACRRIRGSGAGALAHASTVVVSPAAMPPKTSDSPSRPAIARTTATPTRMTDVPRSIMLSRRKARRRRSSAMGTVPAAAMRKSGEERRTKSAVRAPKIGETIRPAATSVSTMNTSPVTRASQRPAWRCSRSTVSRWTRAVPMPSAVMTMASSWAMIATAK